MDDDHIRMESLTILLVTSAYPPPPGGIQTIVVNLQDGLKKAGHDVHLLHCDLKSLMSSLEFKDFLPTKAVAREYFLFHPSTYVFHNFVLRKTNVARNKLKPDIIHVMHSSLFSSLYNATEPTIVSCYGMELQRTFPVKYSLSHATKIHSISNFTSELILRIVDRRQDIQIINPSVKTDIFNAEGIEKENSIITVCRLVKRKNVEMGLKAFAILPKEIREKYTYIILGDGPERINLENLAKTYKLKNVIFKKESLLNCLELFKRSKLFVMCPLKIGLDVEGFGIVFVEANAAGMPVIASRTGGIPEAVGDGGLLVDNENDPKEIAEKIEKLLTNEKLYEKFAENALRRSKKFDNDTITKQFINLYKAAIAQKSRIDA